jgi:hypothetical protein
MFRRWSGAVLGALLALPLIAAPAHAASSQACAWTQAEMPVVTAALNLVV